VEAKRVDAELADDRLRLDDVPQGLVHLPPVGPVHPSMHELAVVRCPIERDDAGGELRVEPTPGLVRTFDDPVLRPPAPELVVPRGISEARPTGHPAVPPDVEDVGDPPHLLAAPRTRQDDLVDPR